MSTKTEKKKLQIKVTPLFEKIRNANTRIIVLEGGTRSSKTYSTLQNWIVEAQSGSCCEYDIIRETLPALKASAMKDFYEILNNLGIYDEENHNKSDLSYRLNGSVFSFYPASDSQKLRGRKRDKALMNEANEQSLETFRQLSFRTNHQIILDYNPSEEEHWIYDHVIPRNDCTFIQSTYLDNPFLPDALIEEIERLKTDDLDYWKIYGLGQRGKLRHTIYDKIVLIDEFPENCSEILYGLDFGYSPDPTVLGKIGRIGNNLYIQELIYDYKLTNSDLIKRMKELRVDRSVEMYADSAEPDRIEEISRDGFNVFPADKGQGSVEFGIDVCKRYTLNIVHSSVNVGKDVRNYKWKVDKNGNVVSPATPAHAFSHGCDMIRYPVATHWGKEFRNITLQDLKQTTRIQNSETSQIDNGFNYNIGKSSVLSATQGF